MDERQARRNVFAAAATGCIGFTGFTLVMPFLPIYIRQLGVTDVGEIAMWTGLTLGATPAVTAVCAPLWGRVGDRYGSKVLVIRSLSAFVLTKAAMAFVTAPWQLLALRALLGVFAGFGALTVSMAAESAPRDRMAQAIGFVQTGHRLGPAIGPVIGGFLAPVVGLRNAFLVAAGFYVLALLSIVLWYREPRDGKPRATVREGRAVVRHLAGLPGFLLALGVIFALQMVDRSFGPVLPLFVAHLGIAEARVPALTGIFFSLGACAAAVGHHLAGRLLESRTPRAIIIAATATAAAAIGVIVVAPSIWLVGGALVATGLAIGVATTTIYAVAGSLLPPDAHATGFGFMTTASLVGLAASPVLAGFIGGAGLRMVFLFDVVLLVGLGGVVARRMRLEYKPSHTVDAAEPVVGSH